jgi:hypothetical protein
MKVIGIVSSGAFSGKGDEALRSPKNQSPTYMAQRYPGFQNK